MAETKVVLKACKAYDRDAVTEAVDAIFAQFGGVTAVVKPGQRVLIKVNLLMKRKPEQATTTHPEVAYAIVRAVQRAGAIAILADSPGGPYTKGMLDGIYNTCGMTSVASETGCILNEDFSTRSHYSRQIENSWLYDHDRLCEESVWTCSWHNKSGISFQISKCFAVFGHDSGYL